MRKLMMALFIAALALPASVGEKQEGETILKDSQPAGAVPSETPAAASGIRRGIITKTGNAHLRRIVVEAAWSCHRPPCIWYGLRKRQQSTKKPFTGPLNVAAAHCGSSGSELEGSSAIMRDPTRLLSQQFPGGTS
jgi:hypothetical protein